MSDTQINAMTIVNGELYIGGYYKDSSGYYQYVAKLNNNNTFQQITDGLKNNGGINAMTVYNNQLYIGGDYQYVAKLNNNKFQQITDGLKNNGSIFTIIEHNEDILHSDESGSKVNKENNNNLPLILGLAIGIGLPILIIIIFLIYMSSKK